MWRCERKSDKKAVKLGGMCEILHRKCNVLTKLSSIAPANWLNDGNYEVLRLLRGTPHKLGRIQYLANVEFGECIILVQSMDEVVRPPVGFHLLGRRLGMTPNYFM